MRELILAAIISFNAGLPFSKLVFLNQNASFESPVDMYNYNVFYDLATLYGDVNKDGILSQDEYNEFSDTNRDNSFLKLIPNSFNSARDEAGELLVDDTFKILGLLPVSDNRVFVYTYTKEQISSTFLKDGYFNYSSSNWEYGLSYYNNPELDSSGKYLNTIPLTSKMKFINEYSLGKDGYFSKFIIEDNQIINKSENAKTENDSFLMRIKPERFIATFNNEKKLDKQINNFELIFDDNYWNDEKKMKNTLFSENTIQIKDSVIDGFLCSSDSSSSGNGWNFLFNTINGNQETTTNSAYEFYYYFFNIDGFDPDSILSITYNYIPITWQHSYYNEVKKNHYGFQLVNITSQVMNSAQRGITSYTREQAKKIVDSANNEPFYIYNENKSDEKKYYLEYSETIGSRITRTVNYSDDFKVEVNVPDVIKYSKHKRVTNIKSIINMDKIDSELGEVKELVNNNKNKEYDVNEQLRSFLKGETSEDITALYENIDHKKYKWAFLIHEEDWIRNATYEKIDSYPLGLTILWKYLTGGIYTYTDYVSKITSTCHEPDGVLVTYMKVAKDDEVYDLNVISNPLSVRKNYIVGYAAPGIIEIFEKAVDPFFTKYGWLFWIVLAVIIIILFGLLGTIFRPIKIILKVVFKGLIGGLKIIINTLYILLVWWWLAIIKKASGSSIPPLWIFKRR